MAGRRQGLIDSVPAIHIVGEGDTEQYYFKHLKRVLDFRCSVYPRFCKATSIDKISKKIKELLSAGVIVICVFDADVAKRVPKENEKLKTLRDKYRRNRNVIFCDSLPSLVFDSF
jgi:hypothetical protein